MIGKEFKKLRMQHGLSQKEFGAFLNVSDQFISNIERGKAAMPIQYIPTIAKIFNIDIHMIVELYVNEYRQHILSSIN